MNVTHEYFKYLNPALVNNICTSYAEPHRKYHNIEHIINMLNELKNYSLKDHEKEILSLAIIYHDIVYNPKKYVDNEKRSCQEFFNDFPNHKYTTQIKKLIMATKNHVYDNDPLENIIIDLDLNVFEQSISELIKYENAIFKEYQFVNINEYIKSRSIFLDGMFKALNIDNILSLKDYVNNRQYKIGIFAGSFNPFHKGHLNILEKAEEVFDKVIVARGFNPDKPKPEFDMPKTLYNEIVEYSGLVTELFTTSNENVSLFFVRGLRNVYDLGYEENLRKNILDINPNINFTYFFCDSKYEHISSSGIKGLAKFDEKLIERYVVK
jgi:pantetheine-phosphate adenylyltransferase